MTPEQMAQCFNEWMRRFIAEPDRFEHEWEAVTHFLRDQGTGRDPSYGETSAAYMQQLARELHAGD